VTSRLTTRMSEIDESSESMCLSQQWQVSQADIGLNGSPVGHLQKSGPQLGSLASQLSRERSLGVHHIWSDRMVSLVIVIVHHVGYICSRGSRHINS